MIAKNRAEAIKMPLAEFTDWCWDQLENATEGRVSKYTMQPDHIVVFERQWREDWIKELIDDYDNRINTAYQTGWDDCERRQYNHFE